MDHFVKGKFGQHWDICTLACLGRGKFTGVLFISGCKLREYGIPALFVAFIYIIGLESQVEICLYSRKSKIVSIQSSTLESIFSEETESIQAESIAQSSAPVFRHNAYHIYPTSVSPGD